MMSCPKEQSYVSLPMPSRVMDCRVKTGNDRTTSRRYPDVAQRVCHSTKRPLFADVEESERCAGVYLDQMAEYHLDRNA
jgi:hypothetical protein